MKDWRMQKEVEEGTWRVFECALCQQARSEIIRKLTSRELASCRREEDSWKVFFNVAFSYLIRNIGELVSNLFKLHNGGEEGGVPPTGTLREPPKKVKNHFFFRCFLPSLSRRSLFPRRLLGRAAVETLNPLRQCLGRNRPVRSQHHVVCQRQQYGCPRVGKCRHFFHSFFVDEPVELGAYFLSRDWM